MISLGIVIGFTICVLLGSIFSMKRNIEMSGLSKSTSTVLKGSAILVVYIHHFGQLAMVACVFVSLFVYLVVPHTKMENRFLSYFGIISWEFYLCHTKILFITRNWFLDNVVLWFISSLVFSIIVAFAFHRIIEIIVKKTKRFCNNN